MFPSSDYYIYYACVKNGVIWPKKLYPEYYLQKNIITTPPRFKINNQQQLLENLKQKNISSQRYGTVEGDSKVGNQHTGLEQNP